MSVYLSIYFVVFASIASVTITVSPVFVCLFVCFAPQQSFINVKEVDTSPISIMATMTYVSTRSGRANNAGRF